jgi:hypothetical protein
MHNKYEGRWAICNHGKLGRIDGYKNTFYGDAWVGTGLDGKPWMSRAPIVMTEKNSKLLDELLSTTKIST